MTLQAPPVSHGALGDQVSSPVRALCGSLSYALGHEISSMRAFHLVGRLKDAFRLLAASHVARNLAGFGEVGLRLEVVHRKKSNSTAERYPAFIHLIVWKLVGP